MREGTHGHSPATVYASGNTAQTAFAYTTKEAESKTGLQAVADAFQLLPEHTSIGITIAKVAALLMLVVVRRSAPALRNASDDGLGAAHPASGTKSSI